MNLTTIPSGDAVLSAAYTAPENPRAVLVLVHGMAEPKERYFPLMTYLSETGIACVITDLRGHGQSVREPDDLGYFGKKGKEALLSDTESVIRQARAWFPGVKLFLMGHSMGSLIVRSFIRRNDALIDGLVVCGSPSPVGVARLGIFLTRCIRLFKGDRYRSPMLENMSTGGYQKKFQGEGLTNAWLSVNRANVQAYNNDPLCGFRFTVNGYRALMQLLVETYDEKGWALANPNLPVHFIAGGNDPCIDSVKKFSKAVSFLRSRGYRQVSSKVYPGMRHEILNETGREDVWLDLKNLLFAWL